LPFDRAWRPNRLTKGWSLYPIVTWRTGFPFDIGARAPGRFDPTNPGPSGAGDPQLANAEQVAPIRYLDPRKKTTINVIDYFSSIGSSTCDPVSTPVTGNFYFDPNSFTNALYYNTDGSNPCFPTFDPVNNPSQRTYGIPRNLLRGPHQTNFDLSLAKTTALKENMSLEFRVECFNIFNHPELRPAYYPVGGAVQLLRPGRPAIEGVAEMGLPITNQVRCLGINDLRESLGDEIAGIARSVCSNFVAIVQEDAIDRVGLKWG
jgi:hypothetical protein